MRRAVSSMLAVAVLAFAGAAVATPSGRSAAGVTGAQAVALVRGVVNDGFACAAPGWRVSGYAATPQGSSWTVHVYARNPKAAFRLDLKFTVRSDGVIEAPNLLAEQVLKCAKYEPAVPKVRAFVKKGVVEPGQTISLEFSAQDASEQVRVHLNIYQGGTWVQRWTRKVEATSLSHRYQAKIRLGSRLVGPLFFCVWAQNAGGGSSKNSPKSSCARIALLVDIWRVSNGCGGAGWNTIVAIQNAFGNTSTYTDPVTGKRYTVNFERACNLHDAGYGGHTVRDELHGEKTVDFQRWTRLQVDNKFRSDMTLICAQRIKDSTAALAACETNYRYSIVRDFGWLFFDADLTKPGIQRNGPRA